MDVPGNPVGSFTLKMQWQGADRSARAPAPGLTAGRTVLRQTQWATGILAGNERAHVMEALRWRSRASGTGEPGLLRRRRCVPHPEEPDPEEVFRDFLLLGCRWVVVHRDRTVGPTAVLGRLSDSGPQRPGSWGSRVGRQPQRMAPEPPPKVVTRRRDGRIHTYVAGTGACGTLEPAAVFPPRDGGGGP